MNQTKEQLILRKDDYDIIMHYLRTGTVKPSFNKKEAEELEAELKKARLVSKEELPPDVVRLNSSVTIRDEKENKLIHLTIVTPEKADIKEKKISVMSPVGTALIGFSKGQQVSWKVPSGRKLFTILDVVNPQ